MRTIHKYDIHLAPTTLVQMPDGARILTVGLQRGQPKLWAEVDTSRPLFSRVIYTIGTGHPVPNIEMTYIGTVQMDQFVWHFYTDKE